MKHIFIINPNAGKTNRVKEISDKLKSYDGRMSYEIYVTKSRGDAQSFVRSYLTSHPQNETYRFYACGGDGTLYDVVNGIYGFKNASLACLALGSGNDFVKNFRDKAPLFKDIDKAINGKEKPIDLIKVNDKYCINITNYGFDGEVTAAQLRFKRIPFVTGPAAYNLAAVTSLLFKMNQYLKVTLDGKQIFEGTGLLAIVANGYCYGGGFYCAPKAVIDDGLLDLCVISRVSKFKAASFMKIFKKGEHLTDPKTKKIVTYLTGKEVTIESDHKVAYAIDGEVYFEPKITCTLLPQALKFVIPE
jgi:diacylglycerol kinase (ATP)